VSQVSANVAHLQSFAGGAGDVAATLSDGASTLRGSLDAFRGSSGWQDFLDEVTPLDVDVAVVGDQIGDLGRQVAAFRSRLIQLDRSGGAVRSADDPSLDDLADGFAPPEIAVVEHDGRTILTTLDGEDHLRISTVDGRTVVERLDGDGNPLGQPITLTPAQSRELVIRSGGGDDVIEIGPDHAIGVTVLAGRGSDNVGRPTGGPNFAVGGSGDDQIYGGDGHDQLVGGAGDDTLYGGDGHDYVDGQQGQDTVFGGRDTDAVYGGAGQDLLFGHHGQDHLEGGSGNDILAGGDGGDTLSGGDGEDVIQGGGGHDTIYPGQGQDTIDGGDGVDTAYAQPADAVDNSSVVIVDLAGTPGSKALDIERPDWMTDQEWAEWQERINSDLQFLRNSPAGRASLSDLDRMHDDSDVPLWPFDEGNRITIRISPDEGQRGGGAYGGDGYVELGPNSVTLYHRDRADDNTADWDQAPPPVIFLHELAHAYDTSTDNWPTGDFTERDGDRVATAPRPEINSVGIDTDGDGQPDLLEDHPEHFTENTLRDEMGLPEREYYAIPADRP
ncbi:MAG: M91 family zinc metallopeptidase, partial [Egibacteraceae bacterium]